MRSTSGCDRVRHVFACIVIAHRSSSSNVRYPVALIRKNYCLDYCRFMRYVVARDEALIIS